LITLLKRYEDSCGGNTERALRKGLVLCLESQGRGVSHMWGGQDNQAVGERR